jgi:hypothetical protein
MALFYVAFEMYADLMTTLVIAQLKQTSPAFPTQWEGRLQDGRPFYIRYRSGLLSVHLGEAGCSMESAVDGTEWFCEQVGDAGDGSMTIEGVCNYTRLRLPK